MRKRLVARKKPEGQEYTKFCTAWDSATHEQKKDMAKNVYGCTYDTAKHWRSEGNTERIEAVEACPGAPGREDMLTAIGEILATRPIVDLDFVCFDLETTNLKADFSVLLTAAIKPFGKDTLIWRADDYPTWKNERADDSAMVADVARELGKHSVVVSHYGCLTPGHKVLTSDLQYVPSEKLLVGQELLAFDEFPLVKFGRRGWRKSVVTHTGIMPKKVAEIKLSDSTVLTATLDHPWLCQRDSESGYTWKETQELRPGDEIHRLLPVWKSEKTSYQKGYLAGFFDGEGNINQCKSAGESRWGKNGFQIAATQATGETLDYACSLLAEEGFRFSCNAYDRPQPHMRQVGILGGLSENLRFLGSVRPGRLLRKFDASLLGSVKVYNPERLTVQSITPIGTQETVALSTSTGTYISEGFGSHNTGFDVPYLRAKMIHYGMPPLPPMFHLDTYAIAKANILVARRRLEALAEYFNLGSKHGVEGNLWVSAGMNGDKASMDAIVKHNIVDVEILERLACITLPYMKSMKKL